MESERLHIPEWVAILTLITALGATLGVVFFQNQGIGEVKLAIPHQVVDPFIWMTIEGAVAYPGRVKVLKGTLLKEALAQVELLSDADTAQLKLDAKVRKGQKVRVASKNWVALEVEGIGEVKVARGSRYNQLPQLITLPEGVERAQFKSKRLLKDGEKIFLKLKEGAI